MWRGGDKVALLSALLGGRRGRPLFPMAFDSEGRDWESDAVQLGLRMFAAKYDALDFCLALRADWLEFNTRLSPFSSILPL